MLADSLQIIVAARTILPSIINSLERINNEQDPLQFVLQEVTYKPFISLFNVTEVDTRYPDLNGIRKFSCYLCLLIVQLDLIQLVMRRLSLLSSVKMKMARPFSGQSSKTVLRMTHSVFCIYSITEKTYPLTSLSTGLT